MNLVNNKKWRNTIMLEKDDSNTLDDDSNTLDEDSEFECSLDCLDENTPPVAAKSAESIIPHVESINASIWAARYGYIVLGMGMASWASLVPYAKERLQVSESELGLLLLCLGLGALFSMPVAGALAARYGCKKIQNICIPIYYISLILLTVVPHPLSLAIVLAVFGAMSGVLDVVMNLQVVFLEQISGKRMMSSLHAMYTVGAALGAGIMALFLGFGLSPLHVTMLVAVALFALQSAFFGKHFYPLGGNRTGSTLIVLPRGSVLILGVICYILYMIEGVIMDWSALFMNLERSIPTAEAGLAYGVFAVTMTIGRLCGDRLGAVLGAKRLLILGCILTTIGFMMIYSTDNIAGTYFAFFVVGLGASNTVPQLFTITSKQQSMEVTSAIAAVSTIGYMGLLSGPALMGFVAQYFGLPSIFAVMAVLVAIMAVVSMRIKE